MELGARHTQIRFALILAITMLNHITHTPKVPDSPDVLTKIAFEVTRVTQKKEV